jgi:hypothetical protein
VEQTAQITITNGKSPYTAEASPSGIVSVDISSTTLNVAGVKTGNAVVTVKGSDGGSAALQVTVTAKPNPLAAFKADDTPRWELPNGTVIRSDSTAFVFLTDAGKLFQSNQNKWGYASLDGMTFRLIEWGISPTMRTEAGTTAVSDFQIVKEAVNKVWITCKINGSEHRITAETIDNGQLAMNN